MPEPAAPADPIGNLTELAAQTAEMFAAFVKAGIPPQHVAVMIGTWMATLGNNGQQPSDGG